MTPAKVGCGNEQGEIEVIHPARTIPFDQLWNGLQDAKAKRLVNEQVSEDGLSLFCYSKSCVYTKAWDEITTLARGLILDPAKRRVVATPFPKFFNIGEREFGWPALDFEVYQKVDGSLIILYFYSGRWRCATKGSFVSEQARWAETQLDEDNLSLVDYDTTFLCEAVYPANKIVVKYDYEGLVLLGGYKSCGRELNNAELCITSSRLRIAVATKHRFGSIQELVNAGRTLPVSEEGFVVRFSNGLRLKVKGDEYCRIHRLVSRVTPLAIWEAMKNGGDLETIRKELPEEFWVDFDTIKEVLQANAKRIVDEVKLQLRPLNDLTNKEVGLRLSELTDLQKRYVFPMRKSWDNVEKLLYEDIRPNGNRLPGYEPTRLLDAVTDE